MGDAFVRAERPAHQTDVVEGGCHCGSIRYAIGGKRVVPALRRLRAESGPLNAHVRVTIAVADLQITKGSPSVFPTYDIARRHFCPSCGAGLFYFNENLLPGLVEVHAATLDRLSRCTRAGHGERSIRRLRSALAAPAFAACIGR